MSSDERPEDGRCKHVTRCMPCVCMALRSMRLCDWEDDEGTRRWLQGGMRESSFNPERLFPLKLAGLVLVQVLLTAK